MADLLPPPENPAAQQVPPGDSVASVATSVPDVAAGAGTSEYQLTKVLVTGSMVISLVFGVLSQLQGSGLIPSGSKEATWVAGGLSVASMLLGVLKALGYTSSRTQIKVAQLNAAHVAQLNIAK